MDNKAYDGQRAPVRGYRPTALTLTGFKGIRSGLGRDTLRLDVGALAGDATLVAIAGANGRGKTTVMDNLTPYLVMPSRAGADGLGAFSYYDHVFLPESQKELTWEHRGRRYKSHLVFRLNGKRKTEAFLFEQSGSHWKPVVLADGTVSDGKVDIYERAVCELLGPPETFFTSVFSAQGKRPLSAYRNGEIKGLLADLLGLDQVRQQGERAAETARLLKNGLAVIRQEQAGAAAEIARLAGELSTLGDPEAALSRAITERDAAARSLDVARAAEAALLAGSRAAAEADKRRTGLAAERDGAAGGARAALQRVAEEVGRLDVRAGALAQRAAARKRQHAEQRARLVRQRDAHRQSCVGASRVAWALRRLVAAERAAQMRAERATAAQALADKADQLRGKVRLLTQQIDGIEREAGQVSLRHADLQRRFGLAAEVPCVGTDLQGRCQLLGDARGAQAMLPSVVAQIAGLRERQRTAEAERAGLSEELGLMATVAELRNVAERRLELANARASSLARLAAREGEMRQAQAALAAVEAELGLLPDDAPAETHEEAAERADIAAARARLAAERDRLSTERDASIGRIEAAIAALPPAFDGGRPELARRASAQAETALRCAEQVHLAAVRTQERRAALQAQHARVSGEAAATDARASDVESELSGWTLLARCLSNDGVIALDIDDAGPTLAGLANDLLLACYGRRFTLEIRTQVATAKGEMREGFDIVVHDGDGGESKSVTLLSGGERVWINECLTRAIALYLAGNAGREYGTLFCDEADGPLDPDRKRMFMDMKREVIRLGGYQREFFVSQTPELTAMADKVIDLDSFALVQEAAT
ncbi:MAG: DNA repair protein [Burkholderiaceae bacterium]|nr:DNA repair protein [Burkholderiaceae bacterium]